MSPNLADDQHSALVPLENNSHVTRQFLHLLCFLCLLHLLISKDFGLQWHVSSTRSTKDGRKDRFRDWGKRHLPLHPIVKHCRKSKQSIFQSLVTTRQSDGCGNLSCRWEANTRRQSYECLLHLKKGTHRHFYAVQLVQLGLETRDKSMSMFQARSVQDKDVGMECLTKRRLD